MKQTIAIDPATPLDFAEPEFTGLVERLRLALSRMLNIDALFSSPVFSHPLDR